MHSLFKYNKKEVLWNTYYRKEKKNYLEFSFFSFLVAFLTIVTKAI